MVRSPVALSDGLKHIHAQSGENRRLWRREEGKRLCFFLGVCGGRGARKDHRVPDLFLALRGSLVFDARPECSSRETGSRRPICGNACVRILSSLTSLPCALNKSTVRFYAQWSRLTIPPLFKENKQPKLQCWSLYALFI